MCLKPTRVSVDSCFIVLARVLGACLLVSVVLNWETADGLVGYLGDLFLGLTVTGLVGVIWASAAMAAIGLLALRSWACAAVYLAYIYTLVPNVPAFSFIPFAEKCPAMLGFAPTTFLLGVATSTSAIAIQVSNLVFVVLTLMVHFALARRAKCKTVSANRNRILQPLTSNALIIAAAIAAWTIILIDFHTHQVSRYVSRPVTQCALILTVPPVLLALLNSLMYLPAWRCMRRSETNAVEWSDGATKAEANRSWGSYWLRVMLIGLCAVTVIGVAWADARDPSRYGRHFHETVAGADRVLVRDGGFNCCESVKYQKVHFEVTDPQEIKELSKRLQFIPIPTYLGDRCMCCGYPGIDWYCNGQRVALTALHHGHRMRWLRCPGDMLLVPDAQNWVEKWLDRHGVKTTDEKR